MVWFDTRTESRYAGSGQNTSFSASEPEEHDAKAKAEAQINVKREVDMSVKFLRLHKQLPQHFKRVDFYDGFCMVLYIFQYLSSNFVSLHPGKRNKH